MKRETIADKGIWKARKMYILNAWDIEGVRFTEPQLKVMGIEAVRSSTPKACRDAIKSSLKVIMTKDETALQDHIMQFKQRFMNLPFADIAFPRGMKGMDKYRDNGSIYTKGTPIHVRAALLFNNLLKTHNLQNQYQQIGDGDKIKFAYLTLPNPLRENVIAILDEMPSEFKLENYIDYETQFQKSFLEPIKSITEVINWKIEITDKETNKVVFEHKYNAENKRVYIHFESSAIGDTLAWFPQVEEFRKKYKCHVVVSTFHNEWFEGQYPELEFVTPGSQVYDLDRKSTRLNSSH